MKYLCCVLLLLLSIRLSAQQTRKGKWLITGVIRDSTRDHISGMVSIGDTLRRAQRRLHQELLVLQAAEEAADAQQAAALVPAREQWMARFDAISRLGSDSAYVVHPNWQTGRFRLWARPTDTLYVEAPHHITQRYRVRDLPRRGRALRLLLPAEPCVPYVACTDTAGREYAFIGRKISLESAAEPYYCNEPQRIIMDSRFRATYQLLAPLEGRYPRDTMRFTVYDHYGRPAFGKYPHVLLFVKEYCGELIHRKYQFYPVYRTADGRWAAPYQWLDHRDPELEPPIRPRLIPFAVPVVVDVRGADSAYVTQHYPAPYYRIENGQAVAVYGNYVEEILENRERLRGPARARNRRLDAELRAKFPQLQPKQP